jgi:hypothetical protein
MRTTLTIDDDVAVQLKRLRKSGNETFKAVVNRALREGVASMAAPKRRRSIYHTRTVDLGRCLLGNIDDVAEALALAEGDDFR